MTMTIRKFFFYVLHIYNKSIFVSLQWRNKRTFENKTHVKSHKVPEIKFIRKTERKKIYEDLDYTSILNEEKKKKNACSLIKFKLKRTL